MIEVADILRLHAEPALKELSPFQRKVLSAIQGCRTAYFGGHLAQCDRCPHQQYSYHSCGDRHCPKCQGQRSEQWLLSQEDCLLNCPYYFLTFTLPQPVRALAKTHPRQIYGLLLSAAAATVQKLAQDPRWVGAPLAILAVLHTWTRALLFHPHVHLLVSAGGLSPQGHWISAKHSAFLVPAYALSKIFRAKVKTGLRRLQLLDQVPTPCWEQKWVVHCQHAGQGQKVLQYLGRYAFRVAITNSRLERLENGQVTFRYRDNRTQSLKRVTLSATEFIRRFTQHFLPRCFVKVRRYGLWHPKNLARLKKAQQLSAPKLPAEPTPAPKASLPPPPSLPLCPRCRQGHLHVIGKILPQRNRPP